MAAASILQIRHHREQKAFRKPLFYILILDLLIIGLVLWSSENDDLDFQKQADQKTSFEHNAWFALQYLRFTMTTILLITNYKCTLRELNSCLQWYFRLANVFYALTFVFSAVATEMWIAGKENDKETGCAIIFGTESIPSILIVGLFLYHPLYGRLIEASRILRRRRRTN